jgi:hypothetical protein
MGTEISLFIVHRIGYRCVSLLEYCDLFLYCLDFMRTLLYLAFIGVMIRMHTFPLYSIRPFYLTLKVCYKVIASHFVTLCHFFQILQSLKKAVSDVILSRRAIHAMSHLFPDVTADDLATGLFLQKEFCVHMLYS